MRVSAALRLACALSVVTAALLAQGTQPASRPASPPRAGRHPDEGKIVRDIRVEGVRESRREGAQFTSAEQILQGLRTRVGAPFRLLDVQDDLRVLWLERRIQGQFMTQDVEGGIRVVIVIEEHLNFQQVEWRGLDHFSEQDVKSLLEISTSGGMNALAARNHALALEDRYRRDGYYFAKVRIEEDAKASKLTFFVDEGPRVRVRNVSFRGNAAFPGEPFLIQQPLSATSLITGARLVGKPHLIEANEPYSERVVEEDLEKLRMFYR